MSRYDDLFNDASADNSVFRDKSELDPLTEPAEIAPRSKQERALATILTTVTEGYLPMTVSMYGPPATGKTITTDDSVGSSLREPLTSA